MRGVAAAVVDHHDLEIGRQSPHRLGQRAKSPRYWLVRYRPAPRSSASAAGAAIVLAGLREHIRREDRSWAGFSRKSVTACWSRSRFVCLKRPSLYSRP
jgi:hypothetical protein